jgi:hypothetical protein
MRPLAHLLPNAPMRPLFPIPLRPRRLILPDQPHPSAQIADLASKECFPFKSLILARFMRRGASQLSAKEHPRDPFHSRAKRAMGAA